jgi:hypothetical protein
VSLPALLTVDSRRLGSFQNFNFEHDQDHRSWWWAISPVDQFSAMPYFIDPAAPENGAWRFDHGWAHADALPPGYLDATTILGQQNLIDVNFRDSPQTQWWLWANLLEHYTASTLLQTLQTAPGTISG